MKRRETEIKGQAQTRPDGRTVDPAKRWKSNLPFEVPTGSDDVNKENRET